MIDTSKPPIPPTAEAHYYVRELLVQWARWATGVDTSGLGYSRSRAYSAEAAGGYREARVPLVNRDVPHLDALIKVMPERERVVITAHYIERGTVRDKCTRLGLSKGLYHELLRAGQRWLQHEIEIIHERERLADQTAQVIGRKYRMGAAVDDSPAAP